MITLRVCVASDDGVRLSKTHMGDTREFHIYDLEENRDAVFVEKRTNIANEFEHSSDAKMTLILQLLHDVDVFVATKKSPNFRKIAATTEHQPVVVPAETIREALASVSREFHQIRELLVKRKNGARPAEIPEI